MMRHVVTIALGLMLMLSGAAFCGKDASGVSQADTTKTSLAEPAKVPSSGQVIVYYLHMNRRCMTCEKLEAYSREAIETGFPEQLKDSSIVWRVENFEQEGNEHFAKAYQLFSQSLILSRQHEGKETDWKNLDQIWKLVGDKEDFIAYVQDEVRKFMNPDEEK